MPRRRGLRRSGRLTPSERADWVSACLDAAVWERAEGSTQRAWKGIRGRQQAEGGEMGDSERDKQGDTKQANSFTRVSVRKTHSPRSHHLQAFRLPCPRAAACLAIMLHSLPRTPRGPPLAPPARSHGAPRHRVPLPQLRWPRCPSPGVQRLPRPLLRVLRSQLRTAAPR